MTFIVNLELMGYFVERTLVLYREYRIQLETES